MDNGNDNDNGSKLKYHVFDLEKRQRDGQLVCSMGAQRGKWSRTNCSRDEKGFKGWSVREDGVAEPSKLGEELGQG